MVDVKEKGSEYCRWMEVDRSCPLEDFIIGGADF
jgi:hypothetical protein